MTDALSKFISILFLLLAGCAVFLPVPSEDDHPGHKEVIIQDDQHRLTLFVSYDYYSLAQVRTPMGLSDAVKLVLSEGAMLPTPKIVDAIYAQGDIVLKPIPMTPGSSMSSFGYYKRHDEMIDSVLGLDTAYGLIVGHKKDIVLTRRYKNGSMRVAIYGWHRSNGNPIQPLSLVHKHSYYDYSHGVRFVSTECVLDGKPCQLNEILDDPDLAYLVSYEGPFDNSMELLRSLIK